MRSRAQILSLSLCGLIAMGIAVESVSAQTAFEAWSGKPAPRGVTDDSYEPGKPPTFGENFDSPAGEGDSYDPRLDPNHPLKNPLKDPGAKWEGNQGSNLNNTTVATAKGDIDWGEKYYEAQFPISLKVKNFCKTAQPVGIFVSDLPYLTIAPVHLAPPGESVVIGTIKLPPAPPPPLRTGAPGEPGWGHVDFGTILIPPGMSPPPTIHQPNFGSANGTVVIWHPWAPDCNPARVTYTITGHMHFKPPPPEGAGGGGPERLATPDVCEVWWLIGEPPAQYKGEDCTAKFRELALRFNQKILPPYISNAPQDWEWLPTVAEVEVMTQPELLAMKTIAEGVLGHRPTDTKPTPRGWPPGKEAKGSGTGDKKGSGTGSKKIDVSIPDANKANVSSPTGRKLQGSSPSAAEKVRIKRQQGK